MGYRLLEGVILIQTDKLIEYFYANKTKHTINFRFFNFGFTLAETLIVLGIIGVIAALVLPPLIAQQEKMTQVEQLKKDYSMLNNGFRQIMVNTGCSDIPCTGILNGSVTQNIKDSNTFNVIKKCSATQTGCHDEQIDYLNAPGTWVPSVNYAMLVFSDGSIIGFNGSYPNCDSSVGINQYNEVCTRFNFIDTNGPKPPNVIGRDVFRFFLGKNGAILPAGAKDNTLASYFGYWNVTGGFGCKEGSSAGDGEACFGRIVEESWQMNY